ncbi:MAG TPA: glycosyltransferase family A protein [Rugosimonospora sp.]|jgi:glycosyltransferase involved in cell wall biosynthesis
MKWPSVGVVVPTRNHPHILRRALNAIDAQAYPGPLRVIVVYDQAEPDHRLDRDGDRPVRVQANSRRPGLAGARNTGVLASDSDLIAFCDDEAEWRPGKLTAQVEALSAAPTADLVSCAVELAYRHHHSPRLIGQTHIGLDRLIRSPIDALCSSSFLIRRPSLVEPQGCGLFAEDAPGRQNEDWDLLVRAARRAPIEHVDEPLVRVRWRPQGHYGYEYAARISSLRWMMARHPEIRGCPPGAARRGAQPGHWSMVNGNRPDAGRHHWAAVRNDWSGPRTAFPGEHSRSRVVAEASTPDAP